MNWGNLGKKIAAAGFPALGGALGGPAGAALGGKLAEALGVEFEPDAIAKTIIADPDAMIALRKMDEEERAAQHARDTESAAVDEANVRAAREIADLNPVRERMAYITLAVLVMALAGLVAAEVLWDIPDMVLGLAVSVIGGMSMMFQQMIGFFFGTSSGSAARARMMAEQQKR